jgi:hypothetical protein
VSQAKYSVGLLYEGAREGGRKTEFGEGMVVLGVVEEKWDAWSVG